MTPSTRDRALTPPEVDQRTQVLLSLLDEQDTIRFRVRASRDELREWRVEARNLAARIDQVRQEIRSGVVVESAQPELPHMQPAIKGRASDMLRELRLDDNDGIDPIDGSSDEPDPETDPKPAPPPDKFFELYPPIRTHHELRDRLFLALTPAEYAKLGPESVESWRPDTGRFQGVDWWCRVEIAHAESGKRDPIAGLTLPRRESMPGVLAQALAVSQPRAPRKKAVTRKGKA